MKTKTIKIQNNGNLAFEKRTIHIITSNCKENKSSEYAFYQPYKKQNMNLSFVLTN